MRNLLLLLCAGLLFSCTETTRFKMMSSKRTGIEFINAVTETDSFHCMSYEYIYNGAGVGVGDLNNDGLQDLVFAANQVSPRVYLNKGNFKFKDITSNFSGLTNDQWFSGVSMADVNSDGWIDVYITSTKDENPEKCKNKLWINNGIKDGEGPTFTEMAEKYGVAEKGQSVNATFLDYDRDGDLDLYVLNNTLTQRMNTSYRAKINDGSAGNNDQLYRNNGNGTFSNVTIEAGIVYEGFGLGLAIGDVNKDGYPDIYVSNDYMSNDLLYINQGNGTFKNEIRKYMSYQTKSSMGNDMADVNNDGFPDMFTGDMMPEKYFKKRQTINGFSYIFYVNDAKFDYEHQFLRNMLHVSNGLMNGELLPYSEVGQMAGIYASEWSWAPLFADYDNDGDKDLLISNGYPKDMTDKDWTKMKVKVYGFVADEKYVMDLAPAVKVQNFAFENEGNLKFVKRRKEWLPDIPTYSYGAAFVDLDNDGDLDYVVNNLNDKAFVLKNTTIEKSEGKAGYLRIKLTGSDNNRMAIGAKAEIWSNGKYQFTEHYMTRGYASSVEPVIHFGISSVGMIDSLKITWPSSGNVTILKNVAVNQTLELDEKDSGKSENKIDGLSPEEMLFTKKEDVLNYFHEQEDYNDFFLNQNILPHKFSQIGPALVKGDINNDGLEDLIIGATNKLPTKVLVRKGNTFVGSEFKGLTTKKPFSESDLSIVDMDGDGDKDVIAVAGGYENTKESEYHHYIYENRKGSFISSPLPIPAFPASVVRPFDFDHDGDIDLFVGARVKKGMFPYSNHSWLILNDKGKLSVSNSSKLDLGMITDAVWSDYDKDGWEDLIISREWNSVAVLKNMQGKELVPVILPEIEDQHGLWYSVTAGDLDQDGDDDYIVGNLGDNHRFTVSDMYPLQLYGIDLDLDGNIDPLTTGYWEDKDGVMTEYPINYLDELMAQSVYFQKFFKDYTSFSYMNIPQILNESVLKRLDFKLHVNTSSSYILWNDGGKFRWEKLPKALQVSPISKILVRDFTGDALPDILLAGNDYSYDVSTGYYDANKGIVLINKGKGQPFQVMGPSSSGLLLKGMVGSLQYFEGDPSFVVAGINRGNVYVYQVNPGKK